MRVKIVLECDCFCQRCAKLFLIGLSEYPDTLDMPVECQTCGKDADIINARKPEGVYHETDD